MITYEQATYDHGERIISLLMKMHDEVGLVPLSPVKLADTVAKVLDFGFCLVALDDEDVVGSISVVEETFWYSDEPVVVDRWFFVREDYRKTRVGGMLLRYLREYAETNSLDLLLGVLSPVDAVRKDKLFRGMTYVGGAWAQGFGL